MVAWGTATLFLGPQEQQSVCNGPEHGRQYYNIEKHRHDAPEGAKIWDMYNKFQLNSKLQQTNDNNFFRFNKTT